MASKVVRGGKGEKVKVSGYGKRKVKVCGKDDNMKVRVFGKGDSRKVKENTWNDWNLILLLLSQPSTGGAQDEDGNDENDDDKYDDFYNYDDFDKYDDDVNLNETQRHQ